MTGLPQEGWYPDPTDENSWRWWDGQRWTTDVEPRETEPEVVVEPVAEPSPAVVEPSPAEPILIETGWVFTSGPTGTPLPVPSPDPVIEAVLEPDPVVAPTIAQPTAAPTLVAEPQMPPVAPVPTPQPEPVARAPFTWDTWSPPDPGPSGYAPDPYREPAAPNSSPNTAWIWLLAFSPYIYGIVAGILQAVTFTVGASAGLDQATLLLIGAGALVVGFVPLLIFADLDGRTLRKRGFTAPSVLWMLLLPPLAYFLARRSKLKRDGARSRGPQVAYGIVLTLQILGALGSAALVYLALSGMITLPTGVVPSGIVPTAIPLP